MRTEIYADTECYPNYWLFKCCDDYGNWWHCVINAQSGGVMLDNDRVTLLQLINTCTIYTFNGITYDKPMILAALAGLNNAGLKALNDALIVGGLKHWEIKNTAWPQYPIAMDHVDMFDVVPGVKIGLKTYMARMHSQCLQDLPYPPHMELSLHQQAEVATYCGNDVIGTRDLKIECAGRLALRNRMGARYEVDLRSKSDAQMSEAILAAAIGYRPPIPHIPSGTRWQITPAPWIQFATPYMQEIFKQVCGAVFEFNRKDPGEVLPDGIKAGVSLPAELKKLRVKLPGTDTVYKFGIGGLHSMETGRVLGPELCMVDSDVAGYYPKLIILLKLLPPELLAVFEAIYNERLILKAKKHEDADGLKIVVNGGFGKTWSKYSFLLNPYAGTCTTINGQLSLLMLIERLHLAGIPTYSANTDGIVTGCTPEHRFAWESCMTWWQHVTGLELEHNNYTRLVQRDVNNYVAIYSDGKTKLKGVFAKSGLLSGMQGIHPDRDISKDAAVAYITQGIPLAQTVGECTDIRKFLLNRKVAGGAVWRGQYLGPTARWYYATNGDAIHGPNGNKVASSDGAWPAQFLPSELPPNIDRARYVAFAEELLTSCGVGL